MSKLRAWWPARRARGPEREPAKPASSERPQAAEPREPPPLPPFKMPDGHVVRPYLTVAAILGRASQAVLRYEWRQIAGFPPEDWRPALERERPHLLLAEAVPDGSKWAAQLDDEPGDDLVELLGWCREQGIRTVLWGRPGRSGRRAAKLFEHVYEPRTPYIQPRVHNPVPLPEGRTEDKAEVPRLTGSYAALLAAYRRARLVVGDPDAQTRAELTACMTPIAGSEDGDPFFEMRRIHAEYSVTPQVDAMLEQVGLPSVRSPLSVTAVLPVSSQDGLDHALGHLSRQRRRPGQLVLLPYGWRPEKEPAGFDDLLMLPEETPRKPAIAMGAAAADGDLVAFVHEDDEYGPHYFEDLVRTFTYTEAGVAGKRTHQRRGGELCDPGHEHRYTDVIAPSTVLARRNVLRDHTEPSVAEFLRRCRQEGVPIWSADRHSYIRAG